MIFRRIRQVCKYGWIDAIALSGEDGVQKGTWSIFFDILHCFFRYYVWSNQYRMEKLHLLSGQQKKEICLKYQAKNTKRDQWVKEFFDSYKFLHKWSRFKYETSAGRQAKRRAAYRKQYSLGERCFVGYDVIFHKHHYTDSRIVTGADCGFSEHVDIDYTGGMTLGDKVWFSGGVKVLTHNHPLGFDVFDLEKGCIPTPLTIRDHVWIGTRAIIMPGVTEIGRGAMISANSFVNTKIPPYAIVRGNPAKIIGFKKTPEEIIEYERNHYNENDRIPVDVIFRNYEKYYLSRCKELKEWKRL